MIVVISLENAVNRARLVRSGVTDFLTGWHNRRYFHNRLREELARAERTGKPLACLMIDVDNFKEINDRFGHLAGDEALKEVARRAEAEIRARTKRSASTCARREAGRAHTSKRGCNADTRAWWRARDGDLVRRPCHGTPAIARP